MRGTVNARLRLRPAIAAALLLCLTAPAAAQDTQRGIKVAPDEDLIERLAPEARIDKTIVLPPVAPAAARHSLVGLPRIGLRAVAIDHGTILSDAEVRATAAAYLKRDVTIEELEELRRRLSLMYFDKGYVNSGLVLPDQQIVDGQVRFREIRGELTTVRLTGNRRLRDAYILKRIPNPAGQPLEINALQTSLQLLEQDPLIRRINAQLLPGTVPGQGVLRLDVAENRRWQIVAGADNHRSPAVGGEQASLLISNRSLTGRADQLTLYGSYADGFGDASASYALPLNSRGTAVQLYGSSADSNIVEEPFDAIDIESETSAYGLSLSQTFARSLTGTFSGFLGMESKHNQNSLLGQPFSFTDGERDGETNVTVVYAGVELARRFGRNVAATRASVRRGVYRNGATKNRVAFGEASIGPDGLFTSFVLQGQYLRNFDWRDSVLVSRLTYQHAWQPLLSMEKLPMGGASTVRGYRENLLVRDNGLVASVEWQVPLTDTDTPADGFDWRRFRLATFIDYGESRNNEWEFVPETEKQRIYSAGLGLLWNPGATLSAELYWGHAIEDVGSDAGDLQDDGFHFRFRWMPRN